MLFCIIDVFTKIVSSSVCHYSQYRHQRKATATFRKEWLPLGLLIFFIPTMVAAAPEILVIEGDEYLHSPTDDSLSGLDAGTYRMLVIPVIGSEAAATYDPEASTLDDFILGTSASLTTRFDGVRDYWLEETWGDITIQPTIIDRFFVMPKPSEEYLNPAFEPAFLESARSVPSPTNVPEGQLAFDFTLDGDTSQIIRLSFDADDGADTAADLVTKINMQLTALVGDQISASYNAGPDTLKFDVETRFVREGTSLTVRGDNGDADDDSNVEVLEALGFLDSERDAGGKNVTSLGLELPITTTSETLVRFTLTFEDPPTEVLELQLPSGTYATVQDIIDAAVNATSGTIALSDTGDEISYALTPANADPVEEIAVSVSGFGDRASADDLGLETLRRSDGVITFAWRNTIKGDWRKIVGEAVGAYMIDALTNESTPAPGDGIADIAFTAGNEAALREAFEDNIDSYHIISVMFLNGNKRAGAWGDWIPIRIQDGGFQFDHTTKARLQINFLSDRDTTALHETGHNLGFGDVYNNGNGNYGPLLAYPNHWEQMANQSRYPSVGAYMRTIASDWLERGGGVISTFTEPTALGTETEQYLLTPLEADPDVYDAALAVPGGRSRTKLIRLPIGRGDAGEDHALLVQNRQEGSYLNADYPPLDGSKDGGLYITDTITPNLFDYFLIPTRNVTHPITDQPLISDSVRPITDLSPASDIDLTATHPPQSGMTVDIVGDVTGPDGRKSLLVDVSRTQSDYLDLSIRPWGAPPYESPDIWIEHGDKETLSDVPLAGNGENTRWAAGYNQTANGGNPLNWIRARITNNGTVDARDVRLQVRVNQPGGMGDSGTWTPLPSAETKDIPVGESAIFSIPWNPAVDEHTCIEVQIFRWDADVGEVNFTNNQTQENVNDFEATSASPWQPARFEFDLGNPYDVPMRVDMIAENLMYGMRVEFDAPFFDVPARTKMTTGGVLKIDDAIIPSPVPDGAGGINWTMPRTRAEGPIGTAFGGTEFSTSSLSEFPNRRGKPIRRPLHIAGFALVDGHSRVPIGGITLDTRLTHKTDIDVDVRTTGDGSIRVQGSTTPPAGGETFEIMVRHPSGRIDFVPVTTNPDGTFDTTVPGVDTGPVIVEPRPGRALQYSIDVTTATEFDPATGRSRPVPLGTIPSDHCTTCGTTEGDWTIGMSAGLSVPHGAISSADTGFSAALNIDRKITSDISLGVQASGQWFNQSGVSRDLDIAQIGPTVKVDGPKLGCTSTFIRGGIGAYWIDGGSTDFGGHLSAGVNRCITSDLALTGEFQYHLLDGGAGEFSTIRIGAERRF